MTNEEALKKLIEEKLGTLESLIEECSYDDVCSAICVNCGNTCRVEPDQGKGYCDSCGSKTVKSILVLAGFI